MYNKIIIVSGSIGSGKSTLAKKISSEFNCVYVSFGDYVREIARRKNIYPNRFNLQELGKELIEKLGENKFIINTISFFLKKNSTSEPIVIDGVRHIKILKEIKNITNTSFIIYIDIEKDILLENITKRDNKQLQEIEKWLNHKTESQIKEIKNYADLIICEKPLEVWEKIKIKLNKVL